LRKHDIECIDIGKYRNGDLGRALDAFESVGFIDACRYCTMPYDAVVVPAGEQMASAPTANIVP
jgi:hypothetical protein